MRWEHVAAGFWRGTNGGFECAIVERGSFHGWWWWYANGKTGRATKCKLARQAAEEAMA